MDFEKLGKRRLLVIGSLLLTPIFAIVHPVSFYIGYYFCFEKTETPFVYVPNFKTFFFLALFVYILLILWKYLFFLLKRLFINKSASIVLFYLFHTASQFPYLVLTGVYINYWGPQNLNVIGFGHFYKFFVLAIVTWFFSFCIFNYFTYLYPRNETES